MAGTFNLQIVTPEQEVFNSEVEMVRLPGLEGSFGVLRNHSPLIAALTPGEVSIIDAERIDHLFVIGGGFFQVANNRAILLADSATEPGAMDEEQARQAEAAARARLAELMGPGFEAEREEAEKLLQLAQTHRRVASRRGHSLT